MNESSMTRSSMGNPTDVNVNTAVITPTDRVRWGPIFAGLVAALSLLALLSVLGVAVGLSAYDPGDDTSRFRVGAGIWGAITMLLAFFFGGWLTARTAALRGTHNGVLNGALVWAIAIPLMAYILTTGAARVADTAANAANAAANVADRTGNQDQVDRVAKLSTGNRDNNVQTSSTNTDNISNQPAKSQNNQISNQDKERAASAGSKAAWGTLVSMLLGLGAAAAGGAAGARDRHHDSNNQNRDRDSGYVPAA